MSLTDFNWLTRWYTGKRRQPDPPIFPAIKIPQSNVIDATANRQSIINEKEIYVTRVIPIHTTVDTLRNYLNDYTKGIEKRANWTWYIPVIIGLGLRLTTSPFQDYFWVSASRQHDIIFSLLIAFFIGFLINISRAIYYWWKRPSVEDVIDRIKTESIRQ